MYINSKNVSLAMSGKTQNWTVTGNAGGVRSGSDKNDVFHSINKDSLYGGAGDDVYYLWDIGSKVVEKANQGVDTIHVRYWGTITLPDHVENVILTGVGSGVGATGATGNGLDNILVAGNSGATLDGAAGNDVLVGGIGADVFSIRAGFGSDVIYNFQHGWDAVKLTGYGFTNFQQVLSKASQVGSDTRIQLSASETLTLRDVSLKTLTGADFNFLDAVAPKGEVNKTLDKAGQAWNANGWFVLNNAWGSGGMTAGKDYTLTSQFNSNDMTGGTTFNWAYPLTTTDARVLAYPAVQFGLGPHTTAGNPSDAAKVLPVQVSDLASLTADYDVSFSGNLGGFNVAFDIWLANSATATGKEVITNEIMVWLHKGGFEPYGDLVGTYTDGDFSAKIYHKGTYTALVADKTWTKGTIDVGDVIAKLKDIGIVSDSEYLRSVELGAEVTSGAGSLTINDLQLNVETHAQEGAIKSFTVDGAGTTVEVISNSPIGDVAPAPSLVEKLLDSNGYQIGTVTTEWPSADKTIVTRHDLAGNLLGTDVTTVGKEKVVQHFDSHYLLTSAEKIVTNADGAVQTIQFDGNWAITGSTRVMVKGAETKTQYYDAKWQPSGMDIKVDEGNGSTMLKHYNASWQLVGAERVAVSDNVTTTQTWDSAWKLLSKERVVINADGSKRVEHFDGSLKLKGYDLIQFADGVEVTFHYNAQNVLLSTKTLTIVGSITPAHDAEDEGTTAALAPAYEVLAMTAGDSVVAVSGDARTGSEQASADADTFVFDTAVEPQGAVTLTGFATQEIAAVQDAAVSPAPLQSWSADEASATPLTYLLAFEHHVGGSGVLLL